MGRTRPKRTRWRFFLPGVFEPLGRECSGNHPQEPWRKTSQGFATADEAAYPEKLCSAVANILAGFLGTGPAPELELFAARLAQSAKTIVQDVRVAAGTQPRGAKHARLIPLFASHLTIADTFAASDPRLAPGHTWVETRFPEKVVPKGSRTIRVFWQGAAGHIGPAGGDSSSSVLSSAAACGSITDLSKEFAKVQGQLNTQVHNPQEQCEAMKRQASDANLAGTQ